MNRRTVRRIIRRKAQEGYSWRKRVRSHFAEFSDTYLFWAIIIAALGCLIPLTAHFHAHEVAQACDGYLPGWEDKFCLDLRDWTTFDGFMAWTVSTVRAAVMTSITLLIICFSSKEFFGPHLSNAVYDELGDFTRFFGIITLCSGGVVVFYALIFSFA
jgi:hypothetical protein